MTRLPIRSSATKQTRRGGQWHALIRRRRESHVRQASQNETPGEVETTGHEWDGIEELNNPLPRWWLWTFYATIIWGIGYVIAYPAWPLISGDARDLGARPAGGHPHGSHRRDPALRDANAAIKAKLIAADLTAIPGDAELNLCHRTPGRPCSAPGARSATVRARPGFRPRAIPTCWMTTGSGAGIWNRSITPSPTASATPRIPMRAIREMPAFGADGLLPTCANRPGRALRAQISGQDHDAGAAAGEVVLCRQLRGLPYGRWLGRCAQGAPKLADAIWLYGGDRAALTETVSNARFGVMPNWNTRLSEARSAPCPFMFTGWAAASDASQNACLKNVKGPRRNPGAHAQLLGQSGADPKQTFRAKAPAPHPVRAFPGGVGAFFNWRSADILPQVRPGAIPRNRCLMGST
jgi:cytochrome c oxidase cbb3-type subunit III